MKEQSSFREQVKYSRRIVRNRWTILRSPMPNEHPASVALCVTNFKFLFFVFTLRIGICWTFFKIFCYCYKCKRFVLRTHDLFTFSASFSVLLLSHTTSFSCLYNVWKVKRLPLVYSFPQNLSFCI